MVIVAGVGAVVTLGLLIVTMNTGCPSEERAPACTRVLFIGNSYTTVNDLPGVFASLARSGGHRVETRSAAVDGWTLANHADSPATATALTASRRQACPPTRACSRRSTTDTWRSPPINGWPLRRSVTPGPRSSAAERRR